ncbi:MAG: 2-oxo acid dehydrogenase subunit E2 [Cohaesibacteraceae bacterium]|nr:2-oxo acid dehydrogenase subunit E2 [Cohaesibacteraceae bacterium]MBL4875235.1 2-oxo acid dehydrogenase subunit E2 [Cohaesibacteraceae bacterium]
MGLHVIKMPDVGEGITEAEIVEWNVSPGDLVREDDILAAVMTDKATVEIPSPVDGRITLLSGELGEMTPVGSVIISIEVEGDGNNSNEMKYAPQVSTTKTIKDDGGAKDVAKPSPGIHLEQYSKAPIEKPFNVSNGMQSHTMPRPEGEKPLASPSVRRRATDAGIQLQFVTGSGPAGHITHKDLDKFVEGQGVPQKAGGLVANTSMNETKIIGLRRKIGERMQDAKQRIPHITYVDEVDMTELEKLRAHLNKERLDGQPKLTILPFIMRAIVRAISAWPNLSSQYDDQNGILKTFGAAHIGVAAQTPAGLMVPVLRHAEAMDIWHMASEVRRLSEAARDGSIKREELTGSTITISSLGLIGGIVSTPVINSPEVAIVGVNKMAIRPVYIDGEFVPRQIMNLSSSFDHRIIDGWDAAQFIQHIRASLENPATLFMER